MEKYVMLEKLVGQTPLEALEEWQRMHPEYRDVPACYAGRLDPMASGKLLILLGDECQNAARYQGLDKEYEIEVLLDVGSDTGDVLGIVSGSDAVTSASADELEAAIGEEIGTHTLPYPAFSSKPVGGKPLFLHALEGTLAGIEIPTHEETIQEIELRGIETISEEALQERVTALLALAPRSDDPRKALGADFRIHDVRNSWQSILIFPREYRIISLTVRCGSGTYMRTLAERIGKRLETKALALSIHRSRIFI